MTRLASLKAAACVLAIFPLLSHALEPDKLFDKVSPSSWVVITRDADGKPYSQGSAVVIGSGRLVTNCHVLKKAKSINITKSNVSYGATLEFADTERDLCQIKVANFDAPAVEIVPTEKLRVGQRVYAIGTPQGLELTLSEGLISSLRHLDENNLPLIQTTAPVSQGSSGGGLFDTEGRLVGIVTFGVKSGQNLNFAHPAGWIPDIEARNKAKMAKQDADKVATGHPQASKNYSGPLRIGETWVYNLTDLYTKIKRSITYRIDRIDGSADRVTFNQGSRIEDTHGRVIKTNSFETGEFDTATPPGGWFDLPLMPGKTWKASYQKQGAWTIRYDLTATVVGEEKVIVPAGEFLATRIDWTGHALVPGGAWKDRYMASVWYCEECNRVVKFSAYFGGHHNRMAAREALELASHTLD